LKVTNIQLVKHHGLYAPVMESGNIMVSGVLASWCYLAVLDRFSPYFQVQLSHAKLAPLRIACQVDLSFCKSKSYLEKGVSTFLATLVESGLHLSLLDAILQW
jgi:hypothetical protein